MKKGVNKKLIVIIYKIKKVINQYIYSKLQILYFISSYLILYLLIKMGRNDKQTRTASAASKNKNKKSNNKSTDRSYNKKRNESSDDDDDDDSDYDSDYDDEDDDGEMDEHEYRKFLQKIFPSKNMNEKIKAGERVKKLKHQIESDDSDEEDDDDEDDECEQQRKKHKAKINKKKNNRNNIKSKPSSKPKKYVEVDSDSSITDSDEEEEEDERLLQRKKRNQKKNIRRKKGKDSDDDSDDYEYEYDDEDVNDSDDDDDDEDNDDEEHKTNGKFNIVLTIGGLDGAEDEDDEMWEDMSEEYSSEDEDEPVSDTDLSDSDDDDVDDDEEEEEEERKKKSKNRSKNTKNLKKIEKVSSTSDKKKKKSKEAATATAAATTEITSDATNTNIVLDESGNEIKQDVEPNNNTNKSQTKSSDDFLTQLTELYKKNKANPVAKECLKICEKKMKRDKKKEEKMTQKTKDKNSRIFRKMVHDKNTTNDYTFFSKLDVDHQKKIIKEMREINKTTRIEKPYRMTLLESTMPTVFKGEAMKKINSLRQMEPGSGEYYKIKNWVDTFMRIPFGKTQNLPVNIDDGIEKCHDFMENAKNILDAAVYGMNDAKMQIMQLLGQLVTNPSATGTAIAIHGPYGTGKTSIVKEGISKILNRPFAFIALGGATDSSFLEGHSYTYEGSTWGKIVQILIESKCMNPVIYFDELDKISDTPKGEEIAGILTHLTDTTQNSQYHDKYFADVDFDLSKCLFIFSYNDESKVNPILLDRMYRIKTKGYDKKQKTIISNQYLLPKIMQQVKFENNDIEIPEETLHYIIETHCNKEDGVRNMKRCLEIIYTKLNLYRLMKPGTNLFGDDMTLTVTFPFKVTKDVVDNLIKKERNDDMALKGMYV